MIHYRKSASFDPSKHKVPKYDIYGQPKTEKVTLNNNEYNNGLYDSDVKIPGNWKGPNPGKTRTKLNEDRKTEFIPHPSFDLDGDGIVGGRDLVIAKAFDKDKDGKLNDKEKSNALEALKKGYETNYQWGVEVSGPNRSYRVLQKRGKICDADDFSQIKDTYPVHPLTTQQPFHKTLTELKQDRRLKDKVKLEKDKKEWDKKHPSSVSRPYILSEFFVDKPKHTSMQQIKNEIKREARRKANLKPEADFSVDAKLPPTLKYVETPAAKSKKYLDERRKRANLTDLKNLEVKQGNTETGIDRIHRKEECIFRMGHGNNRKTQDMLVEQRKREMLENNMRVFGNVAIGIHGKELPKYHKSMAEWWKTRPGFNEKPKESSLLKFKQSMKYWANKDNILLHDIQPTPPPLDDFKKIHVKKARKNQVATSPTKLNKVTKKDPLLIG